MSKYITTTLSSKATKRLGARLANFLKPGNVVTLEGELGTGKTVFSKGIANGLGVKEPVTSPTFTIVKEYEGELPFYHIDAYRLEFSEEDIGLEEYFYDNGITVVEWAQFIKDYLPPATLRVIIIYIDEYTREFQFNPEDAYYERVVKSLLR